MSLWYVVPFIFTVFVHWELFYECDRDMYWLAGEDEHSIFILTCIFGYVYACDLGAHWFAGED